MMSHTIGNTAFLTDSENIGINGGVKLFQKEKSRIFEMRVHFSAL